jgi:hypothetical protein
MCEAFLEQTREDLEAVDEWRDADLVKGRHFDFS